MKNSNNLSIWNENWNSASAFRRDFDRLIEDWFTPASQGLRTGYQIIPACDVEEAKDHYLLTLELAGVRKDDIKLEVIGNQITISGERRNDAQKNEKDRLYSERRFGHFQRILTLPAGVNGDNIAARYQNGILEIMLPKAESAKPRQVKITDGSEEREDPTQTRNNKYAKVAS